MDCAEISSCAMRTNSRVEFDRVLDFLMMMMMMMMIDDGGFSCQRLENYEREPVVVGTVDRRGNRRLRVSVPFRHHGVFLPSSSSRSTRSSR